MKKDFETILDESLSRLKQKESIEACLGRYLQYAAQLEPLLRTALKVEALEDTEPPSAKAMATSREHFLREAARLRAERAVAHKPAQGPARRRRLMLSVAAAVLIALLLALAAVAGLEAPDPLRRLYHWWETRVPQPTMTQPEPTHTPMLPTHTPTATHTLEPTDTPVPTMTTVPPTDTPVPTMTTVPPTDTPYPDDEDIDDDHSDDDVNDESGEEADDPSDDEADDPSDDEADDSSDDEADDSSDDKADDSSDDEADDDD